MLEKGGDSVDAFFIIVPIVIIVIVFSVIRTESYENKIEEYVRSLGGTVVSYEKHGLFNGLGPFMVVGRGRTVYKVIYKLNGDNREGWVRFGGMFGPDWRF